MKKIIKVKPGADVYQKFADNMQLMEFINLYFQYKSIPELVISIHENETLTDVNKEFYLHMMYGLDFVADYIDIIREHTICNIDRAYSNINKQTESDTLVNDIVKLNTDHFINNRPYMSNPTKIYMISQIIKYMIGYSVMSFIDETSEKDDCCRKCAINKLQSISIEKFSVPLKRISRLINISVTDNEDIPINYKLDESSVTISCTLKDNKYSIQKMYKDSEISALVHNAYFNMIPKFNTMISVINNHIGITIECSDASVDLIKSKLSYTNISISYVYRVIAEMLMLNIVEEFHYYLIMSIGELYSH